MLLSLLLYFSKQKAKIFLDSKYEEQSPNAIYPMDIQHLLLYAVMGNAASYKPRFILLVFLGNFSLSCYHLLCLHCEL